MIVLYVLAAVAANLIAYRFGPWVTPFTALVLIGFNFTARDALHERWHGRLRLRLGALIGAASLASWALNPSGGRIALASAVAFALSEIVDTLVYQAAFRRPWLVKANASNAVGAAVDSLIFPTIAFGSFLPGIVLAQFAMKVWGGAIWAFILKRSRVVVAGAALLAASSAEAQVISGNVAWLHNSAVSSPVLEVFAGAPPVFTLRPYVIASLDTRSGDLTYLTRVGRDFPAGRWRFGVGAGAIWLKFLDYHPRPSLSASVFGPGVKGFQPYAIAAYEKTPAWGWTTFVGVSKTFYFRR